jgi:hypothetical protein
MAGLDPAIQTPIAEVSFLPRQPPAFTGWMAGFDPAMTSSATQGIWLA